MVHRPATIHHARRALTIGLVCLLAAACQPRGGSGGSAGVPLPPPEGPYSTGAGTTVGATSYPVPGGAIVVSPTGNDAAAGTADAPYRTVTRAIAAAATGATIVLREGTYRESVLVNKRVTIQSWPQEAAWIDGTQPLTAWAADGDDWRIDGWTTEFDSSPTYTRGAADGSVEGWRFLSNQYPMAAHPDQIWVGATAQKQVASRGAVVPGAFFHDEAANRLFLGTNPAGQSVQASALVRAMRITSAGTVIRGIGFRGFAPSVPDIGAVVIDHVANVTIEHVVIIGSATTGLSLAGATSAVVRNVTIAQSGMLGVQGQYADGSRLENVVVSNNNTERFNQSPNAGGVKITKTRGITVVDSIIKGNAATGLWFDASVSDMVVTGSELRDNAGHGAFYEISQKGVFINNLVTNNGRFGLQINNTADVKVWNNTFTGNDRSINIVQDDRQPGVDYGWDDRRAVGDPSMTWVNKGVVVANNVIANQRAGNCLLCVEDYQSSDKLTAEQMGVVANGNVYNRPSTSSPSWMVVWSRGAANAAVFTSLAAFKSATGQETGGVQVDGPAVVSTAGVPTAAMPAAGTAQPLPTDIAALAGQPAGTRHLGAWGR